MLGGLCIGNGLVNSYLDYHGYAIVESIHNHILSQHGLIMGLKGIFYFWSQCNDKPQMVITLSYD